MSYVRIGENIMKKTILILLVVIAVTFTAMATTIEEATAILTKVDNYSNFNGESFSSTISLVSEDPEDGIDKTVIYQFRDDDNDKFLILIKEPTIKKGQGYLKIGDNLWFYDPESRKFSHTSMAEQFSSSDANYSDFTASTLMEDYKITSVEDGKLGNYDCNVITLEALNDEVTYPIEKVWVTKTNDIILKQEDYSKSKKLIRSSYFLKYKQLGDNLIPTKIIFNDELIENKKTTIILSDVSTNEVPESVFTKAYIERVNN